MYEHIWIDYFSGLLLSLRFDYVVERVKINAKLSKVFRKIVIYNLLINGLPSVLRTILFLTSDIDLIDWLTELNLGWLLVVSHAIVSIFNTLFHLLHFIDLLNIINCYRGKSKISDNARKRPNPYKNYSYRTDTVVESISLALTMSIYQFVIYLIILTIDLINNRYFLVFQLVIKFIILAIYHSFYCFNNLWQFRQIKMHFRIDMHEKLWPFYIGYGTLISILYLISDKMIVLALYNIYTAILISLPFVTDTRYPSRSMPYPSINLTIFAGIAGRLFQVSQIICQSVN